MKRLSIIGSTGSIGRNALDIIRRFPDRFQVIGLSAGENVAELAAQIREFHPLVVSMSSRDASDRLHHALREGSGPIPEIGFGQQGLIDVAAASESNLLLAAVTGAAGLVPTYHAARKGKQIALANKETLVVAGELVMRQARDAGALIVPVDSEHSALHQCLCGHSLENVSSLILTASGGPFLHTAFEQFGDITRSDALQHPTWKMGKKITIDSATLMNKGLEVIEATHLFGVPAASVRILIHPQSVVHSMVEMIDGSVLAHLGITDMRAAILYALSYPDRWGSGLPRLDLTKAGPLEFFAPDFKRFPCPRLAYQAAQQGGTAPAILNASNEVAVDEFLRENIAFLQIPEVIERTLEAVASQAAQSLEVYLEADRQAREAARAIARKSRSMSRP